MRLQKTVAIVTGGGSGMGAAIAETFAREGAHVAVVDVDGDAAKKVARKIGNTAIAITCDVTKRSDIDAAVVEPPPPSAGSMCWSTMPASRTSTSRCSRSTRRNSTASSP